MKRKRGRPPTVGGLACRVPMRVFVTEADRLVRREDQELTHDSNTDSSLLTMGSSVRPGGCGVCGRAWPRVDGVRFGRRARADWLDRRAVPPGELRGRLPVVRGVESRPTEYHGPASTYQPTRATGLAPRAPRRIAGHRPEPLPAVTAPPAQTVIGGHVFFPEKLDNHRFWWHYINRATMLARPAGADRRERTTKRGEKTCSSRRGTT